MPAADRRTKQGFPEDNLAYVPKLVALQVLRALAAFAIALLHLEPEWRLRGLVTADWRRPFPLEAGVDVFFVISGFVMVYASHALFGRGGVARDFVMRRIARVVPLYWLTTALVLAIATTKPDLMRSTVATAELVLASFLFVPWPRPDGLVQPLYSLGWTLNYEMFFYALFAAALLLRLGARATVAVVSACLAALVGIGLLVPDLPQPLGFWTSPMQIEFILGMALGLARLSGLTAPLALRLGLAALGIGLFWLAGGEAAGRYGQNAAFLYAIPSACLVAAFALSAGRPSGQDRNREPDRWPARLGESLGDASYAIYLLHPFAIRGSLLVIDRLGLGPALGAAGLSIVGLAATAALALLSYRLLERPLLRLARRWTTRPARAVPHQTGGARAADPG